MSHYQKLKAMKTGFSSDFRTAIYAGSISHYASISGIPPLMLTKSKGLPLRAWSITGSSAGVGDYDAETKKYRIPVVCGNQTTNILLDYPLIQDETIDSSGNRTLKGLFKAEECTNEIVSANGTITANNFYRLSDYITVNKAAFITATKLLSDALRIVKYDKAKNFISVIYITSADNYKVDDCAYIRINANVDHWDINSIEVDGVKTVDVPKIMTAKGNCTIDVDTTVKPTNMTVVYKGGRI